MGPSLGRRGGRRGAALLFRVSGICLGGFALIKVILLVEDNASDGKLTLLTFEKCAVRRD
jgi:hypothetical protein